MVEEDAMRESAVEPVRIVIIHNQALVRDALVVALQAESTLIVIGAGGMGCV